MFNNKTTHKSI